MLRVEEKQAKRSLPVLLARTLHPIRAFPTHVDFPRDFLCGRAVSQTMLRPTPAHDPGPAPDDPTTTSDAPDGGASRGPRRGKGKACACPPPPESPTRRLLGAIYPLSGKRRGLVRGIGSRDVLKFFVGCGCAVVPAPRFSRPLRLRGPGRSEPLPTPVWSPRRMPPTKPSDTDHDASPGHHNHTAQHSLSLQSSSISRPMWGERRPDLQPAPSLHINHRFPPCECGSRAPPHAPPRLRARTCVVVAVLLNSVVPPPPPHSTSEHLGCRLFEWHFLWPPCLPRPRACCCFLKLDCSF